MNPKIPPKPTISEESRKIAKERIERGNLEKDVYKRLKKLKKTHKIDDKIPKKLVSDSFEAEDTEKDKMFESIEAENKEKAKQSSNEKRERLFSPQISPKAKQMKRNQKLLDFFESD